MSYPMMSSSVSFVVFAFLQLLRTLKLVMRLRTGIDFFQARRRRLLRGVDESESDGLDGEKLALSLVLMGGMECSGASHT